MYVDVYTRYMNRHILNITKICNQKEDARQMMRPMLNQLNQSPKRIMLNLTPKRTMHTRSPSADIVSAKTDSISAKYFCICKKVN